MTRARNAQKPIVITDAYSPTNVGDSELVRLTVAVARRRYPDQPVTVLAADPDAFAAIWPSDPMVGFIGKPLNRLTWKALTGARRWLWLARQACALAALLALTYAPIGDCGRRRAGRLLIGLVGDPSLRGILRADRVVGVGGGYLGSRYVVTSAITLAQFRIARRSGIPVETMPLSIASSDRKLDALLRIWGNGVDWRARDQTTFDILKRAGLAVALAPDLAWLDSEIERPHFERAGLTVAPVGSSFYGADGSAPKAWPAVEAALSWLPASEPVRLVAMHRWDPRLEDGRDDEACAALAELVRSAYPERNVEIVTPIAYRDVRHAMSTSRVAIAERLHAALAALTTATPCQVISYEPKHAGVLRIAGLDALTEADAASVLRDYPSDRLDAIGKSQAAQIRASVGLDFPLEGEE